MPEPVTSTQPLRPEPTKQYLMTENQLRVATIVGTVGMFVTLVVVLLLASSKPQGRFQILDPSGFQASLARATADLDGYALLDGGHARIDIDRAMELVAQRGVADLKLTDVTAAAAAAAAPAAAAGAEAATTPATTGADTGADTTAAEPGAQAAALPDGGAVYDANCAACHQATGQGIPGAFPPLADHLPAVYAADREFPILTVLFGMMGSIDVHGQSYNGLMPAWGHLSDGEIAATLNHELTSWGNDAELPDDFEPYTAADVASHRDRGLDMNAVHELRGTLDLGN